MRRRLKKFNERDNRGCQTVRASQWDSLHHWAGPGSRAIFLEMLWWTIIVSNYAHIFPTWLTGVANIARERERDKIMIITVRAQTCRIIAVCAGSLGASCLRMTRFANNDQWLAGGLQLLSCSQMQTLTPLTLISAVSQPAGLMDNQHFIVTLEMSREPQVSFVALKSSWFMIRL